MNKFVIRNSNEIDYSKYIIWLSAENLSEYQYTLESSLYFLNISGRILIDQLFLTGDSDNRFISCEFGNGKLNFQTAYVVQPAKSFRKETVEWLHNHYSYVENSILTEIQRKKIRDQIIF